MNNLDLKNTKFSIGQSVMYRRYGVCTIVSTELQKFGDTERLYYSLEPMFGKKTKFFIPADMAELDNILRLTYGEEELLNTIKTADKRCIEWEEDSRTRSALFDKLLKNGDLADMIWLIKILTLHKEHQKKIGRTFLDIDKRVLAFAERLVTDEFAFVLGMDKDKVIDFIRKQTNTSA